MTDIPEINAAAEVPLEADLQRLRRQIEKQTGFAAELKVAKIILASGWSYKSNPRIKSAQNNGNPNKLEIDFIASITASCPKLIDFLGPDGYLHISVVIDVKKYSRPVVVFSSPITDQDYNSIYSDLYCWTKSGSLGSDFCLLHWREGPFGGYVGGRSAVVVNNHGEKTKDFDFHQIYSAIDGLYEASRAVRLDQTDLQNFCPPEGGSRVVNVIIPVIVWDGLLLDYRIASKSGSLRKTKVVSLSSHILGENDRLLLAPSYIVQIAYFKTFLRKTLEWAADIEKHEFDYRARQIENS